jgi:hypothetical protein
MTSSAHRREDVSPVVARYAHVKAVGAFSRADLNRVVELGVFSAGGPEGFR